MLVFSEMKSVFLAKIVREIKWNIVPDVWPERRLGEETGALRQLCLLLRALIYLLMMVWQRPSPSLINAHKFFSTFSRKESQWLPQEIFTLNEAWALTFHLPLFSFSLIKWIVCGVWPHQYSVPCPSYRAHPLAWTLTSLFLYTLNQQEHHAFQT